MQAPSAFPASVLRPPSASASCTCEHWLYCNCECHGRNCDPSENTCDVAYLADEGGITRWGCPTCTRGEGAPHYLGCELIGWNVTVNGGGESAP
jgi:hypothetical protein